MASVYEIVIRNATDTDNSVLTEEQIVSDGKTTVLREKRKPTVSKSAKLKIGGGNRTGVEHNRYERAINTTMNKFTGGLWERGSRITKAGIGAMVGSTVGMTIIFKEFMDMIFKEVLEPLKQQANERNEKDILRIRVGDKTLSPNYSVKQNWYTGRIHYKTNR